MTSKSIAWRALLAILLMVGFYVIAIGIAFLLLYIPYAEVVYAHRIMVKITLFCIIGAFIILWSILPRPEKFIKPGLCLNKNDHPKLYNEIRDIAEKTGQIMPKEVYLINNVNAWVSQRGGLMGIGSKRIMGLGLPLLKILSVSQFRAVLAHEFGHYYSGDTKLAPLVYRTRFAIERTLRGLASHSATLQRPFIWYGNMFLRVSHSVSRAQEYTADKLAARIVGAEHIINGLSIIHGAGAFYDYYWQNEVAPVLNSGYRPLISEGFGKYLHAPQIATSVSNFIQKEIDNPKPNPYSTHPPLKERIEAVKGMLQNDSIDNKELAISLLEKVPEIENQLLTVIADKEKVNALKNINWTDTGEQVFIPIWESIITEQAAALKDVTPADLSFIAKNPDKFFKTLKKGFNEKITIQQLANSVIGAALAFIFYKKGWKVQALPGEEVILEKEELTLEPFRVLSKLATGEIGKQDWDELCDSIGITGINIGKVAVGGDQREMEFVG